MWVGLVASGLLLQQAQLLQSLPSVFIGHPLWRDPDADTGGPGQLVSALSLVRKVLGAPLLLQVSQLAHLDTLEVLPRAQGGRARPGITQDAGRDPVRQGAFFQRAAGLGAGRFLR